MKSVSQQLADYLKAEKPAWISSGELQRRAWTNKDGTLATPRSIVRRLEELVEDGLLKVEYREKKHAWYSWGDKKRVIWEYEMVGGVRVPKEITVSL